MDSFYGRRVWSWSSSSWPPRDGAVGCFVPEERMGRSEFCRSHGMALSTLAQHLKRQSGEQRLSANTMTGESRLIAVELAAMWASAATGKQHSALRFC